MKQAAGNANTSNWAEFLSLVFVHGLNRMGRVKIKKYDQTSWIKAVNYLNLGLSDMRLGDRVDLGTYITFMRLMLFRSDIVVNSGTR